MYTLGELKIELSEVISILKERKVQINPNCRIKILERFLKDEIERIDKGIGYKRKYDFNVIEASKDIIRIVQTKSLLKLDEYWTVREIKDWNQIVKGKLSTSLEKNSDVNGRGEDSLSRDFIFEKWVWSKLLSKSEVEFCEGVNDINFRFMNTCIEVECKRPKKLSALGRNIEKAIEQIKGDNGLVIVELDCSIFDRNFGQIVEHYLQGEMTVDLEFNNFKKKFEMPKVKNKNIFGILFCLNHTFEVSNGGVGTIDRSWYKFYPNNNMKLGIPLSDVLYDIIN